MMSNDSIGTTDFTGWRYYADPVTLVNIGVMKVFSDGSTACRLLTDPHVAAWIAAGGVPLP